MFDVEQACRRTSIYLRNLVLVKVAGDGVSLHGRGIVILRLGKQKSLFGICKNQVPQGQKDE